MSKWRDSRLGQKNFYQKQEIFWQGVNRLLEKNLLSLFLLATILTVGVGACSGNNANNEGEVKLRLVSYSVTKAAHDKIIPLFVAKWKKEHNQTVTFEQSYGGSSTQADAVIANTQEADVVHLAHPLDVSKIQEAGLIKPGWEERYPRNGIVTRSVMAVVTREGNPLDIQDWKDLTQNGLKIIITDPNTSGIGKWQFLSFWGSMTQAGNDDQQALDFVREVYRNAPSLLHDAREATNTFFVENKGDVLLTYENEVIFAGEKKSDIAYSIPKVNISIDNPVAVVDENVNKHGNREVAEAFVDFLYSEEAQREFANLGYRPVNPFVSQEFLIKYPQLETIFTAIDLGGWTLIQDKFFSEKGIFPQIKANNNL